MWNRMMACTATVLLCGLLSGCAAYNGAAASTLYERLGGDTGVSAIVDAFLDELSADPLIVDMFADTDIAQFRGHLIDQICMLADGGCEYTGRNMREAHTGLGIGPRHFNALVEDLMDAMDTVGTPLGPRNELLGLLAPMYQDMVPERTAAR